MARVAFLYLRSRKTGYASIALAVVATASWATAYWLESRPGLDPSHLTLILGFAPLAAACAVGASARAPFGESENTAARYLPAYRFGHFVGLLGFAGLLLLIVSSGWEDDVARFLVRNLLGFSGMALIGAYALGGRLSWVLPVGFAVILPFAGRAEDGGWLWWAWTERPVDNVLSWLIAVSLLGAGVGVVSLLGTRETPGEAK